MAHGWIAEIKIGHAAYATGNRPSTPLLGNEDELCGMKSVGSMTATSLFRMTARPSAVLELQCHIVYSACILVHILRTSCILEDFLPEKGIEVSASTVFQSLGGIIHCPGSSLADEHDAEASIPLATEGAEGG